jgi:triacylglycerol lipase
MTFGPDIDILRAGIAKIPRGTDDDVREPTRAIYGPLHPTEQPHRVRRDLAYGAHPRQLLDLHLPTTDPEHPRPVLLFVHGGGFTGGDKGGPGRPFYDNIGRFAVEHGFVGASMTYRFAPEVQFPAQAEDVAQAVVWLVEHVGEFGGRANAIVVMGHSAGAANVATYVADPALRTSAGGAVRGAVLSSGIYAPLTPEHDAPPHPYYGGDADRYPAFSAVRGVAESGLPLLITVAEFDPPEMHRQAARLALAITETTGQMPGFCELPGHNHFSATWHIGTADTWYPERLADFIRTVAG